MRVSQKDVLLKRGGNVSQRPGNKVYHEILKSNIMLYKCLPKERRCVYASNIFHFITEELGRSFVQYNAQQKTYERLEDPKVGAQKISAAIRDDKILRSANSANPLWILGIHDPKNIHSGSPFVCLNDDGKWERIDQEQVKSVLSLPNCNGYERLMVLPAILKDDVKHIVSKSSSLPAKEKPVIVLNDHRPSQVPTDITCTNHEGREDISTAAISQTSTEDECDAQFGSPPTKRRRVSNEPEVVGEAQEEGQLGLEPFRMGYFELSDYAIDGFLLHPPVDQFDVV